MPTLLFALALSMTPPKPVATPFPLSAVRLTGGPFERAHEATARYLLELDPDRLLAGFRANSGLAPKGEVYGGWEAGGLAGHSLGHTLSALSQEFARTGDPRFRAKIDALVDGLAECQRARPDGFLSAFRFDKGFDRKRLDAIWADVAAGRLRSGGFDLNGMWSPWYVHHKVLAGLLDAQALGGNPKALGVAERFAGWAYETTKALTPEQWQRMLGTEYGGVNESFAELYRRTGDPRDLKLAREFYDERVLGPLARGEDDLAGKHSNTQIPKVVGLARLYELTGDARDRKTAEFFWHAVVDHRTYAIGGNSNGEYLGPPDRLADRITTNTCETCNTYNMLKLTEHLFAWSPSAGAMDFYERAYLNHILASQEPETGMVTYFVPLATNSRRSFSNPFDDFTCCHGSGMENHTKHGDAAYFHDGARTLWVNLFMPTELTWKEAGVTLRQETAFPESDAVSLVVEKGGPRAFEMWVRHPGWAKGPIEFRVNGKAVATSTAPSSYASIRRTWRKGDRLEFRLPMALHAEATPDDPKRVALLVGPVVLAADLGPADRAPSETFRTPVLVAEDRPLDAWLRPVPGHPLTFRSKGAVKPDDLTFAPFYALAHRRTGVYFDRFTPAEWTAKADEYRAEETRRKDLEARTVDAMTLAQMQPERDHRLTESRTDVREQNERATRQPLTNGWMEFDLKVDPDGPNDLVLTLWGNDRSHPEFTILADGLPVLTDDLAGKPLNRYYDATYALPEALTKGKRTIRVRVEARPTKVGPTVAAARTVRRK